LLEVDVLVVVVVVVAVDPVVDVRHSVEDGECHSGKHQGNKLCKFCSGSGLAAGANSPTKRKVEHCWG